MPEMIIGKQNQILNSTSNNHGTNGLSYVMIDATEVIDLLKDLEGLKRKLLRQLNNGG